MSVKLPHVFNEDGYCTSCGVNMNITADGEPCPALNPGLETQAPEPVEPVQPRAEPAAIAAGASEAACVTFPPGWKAQQPQPQVWLAVQSSPDASSPTGQAAFQIIGVFSTEVLAIAACRSSTDCVGPWSLNFVAPRESEPWLGSYYPLAAPPIVIGNLEGIFELPIGHVVIDEPTGIAFWHQAGVPPEENNIPGTCPECGSGPAEGHVGLYVLPFGWPYSPPCRTCERRTRQLFYNIGYATAKRSIDLLAESLNKFPDPPPETAAADVDASPAAEAMAVPYQPSGQVSADDILVETLRVGVFVNESGDGELTSATPEG